MCYAVIEVKYRNKTEPDSLLSVSDLEDMDKRMALLKKNDMVERLRIFRPSETITRVVEWNSELHD